MQQYIIFICDAFMTLTAILGGLLTLISLGFIFKRAPAATAEKRLRFAALIPARNEEQCIPAIVAALAAQNYPPELIDVCVIPNNCTDDTAGAAKRAGARVIRVSPAANSKGKALGEAFTQLLRDGAHDAYCVFDADNEPAPDFISHMNRALTSGARAAKSSIYAKNPHDGWVCACYDVFFCCANRFLNAARRGLGLSARLIGTGFAVRRDLMEELGGWNTATLTEDAEFYATLAARGEHIAFVPEAVTYDEQPTSFRTSLTQRRRWMSGIMTVAMKKSPELMKGAVKNRPARFALDALLQLSFTTLQALIIPFFLLGVLADPRSALTEFPLMAVRFYSASFFTGLAALALEKRLTLHTLSALFMYPVFIFSFLPIQTFSLLRPNKTWTPIIHSSSPTPAARRRPRPVPPSTTAPTVGRRLPL